MGTLVMVGQVLLGLSILIILHEGGHYLAAKWFKTKVEKFYLFFDFLFPFSNIANFSLFKKQVGETEYGIGWFPLGGYVKIAGMVDESMDTEMLNRPAEPWEFRSKPSWQRLIIMLGGIIVNLILGIFIYSMMLWYYGEEFLPAKNATYGIYADSLGMKLGLQTGDKIISVGDMALERLDDRKVLKAMVLGNAKTVRINRNGQDIDLPVTPAFIEEITKYSNQGKPLFEIPFPFIIKDVVKGEGAEKGGLKVGDRIIAFNGTPAPYYQDYIQKVANQKNATIALGVLRGTDTITLQVKTNENAKIGTQAESDISKFYTIGTKKYGFFEAFPAGFSHSFDVLNNYLKGLGKLVTGQIKASESLGGIGTFGKMYGDTWNWERFWGNTALISLILALMNLLPIPGLDGGYVMFLLYEMITGKKPSDKFMEWTTTIGLVLILGLMLYANGLDIMRGCK